MKVFLAYVKVSFLNNSAYRVECLLGILNTCLQIFISCAIWRVLYADQSNINGISFPMIATNFIIALGLFNAFTINDFAVQSKIWDGTITSEFLKPIEYRVAIFATNLGDILFKLLTNFLPALLLSIIFIGILPPVSTINLLLFFMSIVLGFLILWFISAIIQVSAFWIINVWSVSTIKNVIVSVFSGMLLPLWFMPESIRNILQFTPFDSIYFIPIDIYLGQINIANVWSYFLRQLIWIVVLYFIGKAMWELGKKRLIVQGG